MLLNAVVVLLLTMQPTPPLYLDLAHPEAFHSLAFSAFEFVKRQILLATAFLILSE